MACHDGIARFRWSMWILNGLNLLLLLFISFFGVGSGLKAEKLNVSDALIRKELVDISFAVGGGSWTFTKDSVLDVVDRKYTSYENVLFIEFKDEKLLELPEPKFANGIDDVEKKQAKFNVDGMLKMVFVSVKGQPFCTNISVIEFRAKKKS